jgi:hypothetical protein
LCPSCLCASFLSANPPTASYIFPAGGQRGTAVDVRVGGLFLHDQCQLEVTGTGVKATPALLPAKRVWFEGPLLPIPESQAQEDYPADMRGSVVVAKEAATGPRRVRVFTAQGGASGPVFVVGELPEVVEHEIDGEAIPEPIQLPVTANGRIFPREDIDLWEFDAQAGQTVTAFVHAAALNSPMVPRLDILDANGTVVAAQMLHPCNGTDASAKFTPKASGKYWVRISDARALGGPAYVYRLTVTTANVPAFHFPLQAKADELTDATDATKAGHAPVALNGRIERPGIASEWKVNLKKATKYTLDLQARRYESPLCGVVRILDATGKELAKAEASETADPAPLAFTPPAEGTYTLRVSEKYRGRGGPEFVYRLRVLDGPEKVEPGFRLTVANDVFTVNRGGGVGIRFQVERFGGFTGPISVGAADLPNGVSHIGWTVPAGKPDGQVEIIGGATAAIGHSPLKLIGNATIGGKSVSVPVASSGAPDLRLAVAFPTPFKIIDQYVMTSAPRGEVYHRKYKVDRGTFLGSIQVQLADHQARHLQGVTGPVLTLKPGETEFDYPAYLPPWMELGRTCRVCVMATAKVRDPVDGREHTVSFSSIEQNQQMIVVVTPGRLDVALEKSSIRVEGEVRLAVKIARSKTLTGAAKIEIVPPEHWRGITALPLTIPAHAESAELVLRFAKDCGPFNAPLVIRAMVETKETPVTAEAKVDVVR